MRYKLGVAREGSPCFIFSLPAADPRYGFAYWPGARLRYIVS